MGSEDRDISRILVVDDEDVVVNLVVDALEADDMDLHGVTSGDKALELVKEMPFDLLVTDIRMPGMTGIELAEKVHDLFPDISIIFMTGYANLNSAKDAIKQGAMDYIMKPFELHEIRQSVQNALEARRESAAMHQTDKLHHLSDLNRMLFTANDPQSIIVSSTRFAMMHQRASLGAVFYREHECETYLIVSIDGNEVTEREVLSGEDSRLLDDHDCSEFQRPMILRSLDELPFCRKGEIGTICDAIRPPWMTEGVISVAIPVRRTGKLMAIMLLGFEDESVKLREADMTFLEITANQLVMSLENSRLLRETQLAYARLRELQDETIELEKLATRGQLSAEIGHELNNFLGVVAGNLSLLDFHLQKGNLAELEKYVATMTETIEKMKRFTGNLMDLRSVSSKSEVIRFDEVIQEVIEYLQPQKRFQDVEIDIQRLDYDLALEADATQILQLLYNLFNNAADATIDSQERRIAVEVARDADGSTFTLSISDTGQGFPQEMVEKAFQEKFTTKKSGHGFGLVVCRRIIDQHGGKVSVESSPGRGTTITVAFPIAQEIALESEPPEDEMVTTATAAATPRS